MILSGGYFFFELLFLFCVEQDGDTVFDMTDDEEIIELFNKSIV